MSAPDLLYSDIEQQLRGSVRSLLAARAPAADVMRAYDEAPDFSPLWVALATELGLAALLIPEERGGAGAGLREVSVVCEEIGRAAAPVPFLTSAVIATTTLLQTDADDLVARLAGGESTAAVVVSFSAAAMPIQVPVSSSPAGLQGQVRSVAGLELADLLIVPVQGDEGLELHAVEWHASGVTVTAVPSLDMTRPVSDIAFTGAPSRRLTGCDAREAIDLGLRAGAAALASEQVGIAAWCLDSTLAYVKERFQFGRAIGSFQAIKHRLADLWVEIGQTGAAARYAADVLAHDGDDADIAVAVAQSYCSIVAVHAAEECVQLHGGIGMTWEFPAHLYLKRAKADEIALGTPFDHRTALAKLVNLPPT